MGDWVGAPRGDGVRRDWVINSDADEFYWPRGGTLKEVLSAFPAPYGGVRGMLRTSRHDRMGTLLSPSG